LSLFKTGETLKNTHDKSETEILRQMTEELLKKKPAATISELSEAETQKLINELQMHQIELRHSWAVAEVAADTYIKLYDFSPSGYVTLSREGKIIELNLCGSQMLGQERSHLKNSPLGFFVSDDTKLIFNRFLENVFSNKTKETCEVALKTNSNLPLFVHLTGIATENGELCYISVVDITERKRAEEALKESEVKYRVMFEKSSTGILVADIETHRFLYSNSAICRMFGYSEDEFQRLCIADIHPKDSLHSVMSAFEFQIRGEKMVATALPCLRKDGTVFYADISGTPATIQGLKCNVGFFTDVTTQKLAEGLLKESEQRLSTIYNTVGAVIFHFAVEGEGKYRFISVNQSFRDITGLNKEQVVGKMVNEVIPEPSLTMVLGKYKQAIDGKRIIRWEETSVYPAGRLTGEVSIAPVFDDKGRCIHLVGSVLDITERKQAEDALRESQAKYQAIFESTGTATLIVEEDTTILMANNECFSITGYIPAELIGQKWIQYVAPESLQEMLKNHQLRRQNPGLAPKKYEVKLVNKKGEIRDAILDISVIPDTRQSVVSILDITASKKVLEELRLSEEKYRTLIENMGEGVGFINEDEIFVFANPSAEKIFGVDKGGLMGLCLSDFLLGENIETIKNESRKRRQGKTSSFEHEIVLKDGNKKDILVTATPSFDDKKFIGTFAIFRDITERKRAEEEIRSKNKELQVLNAEKDKFFSVIAHDLRSPFNSLLGFTQIMEEELPTMTQDQIQKIAVNIRKSAISLYRLLENLLDWSRLQRNVITYNPEPVLLMPTVLTDTALAIESANKKKIDLSYDIPEDLEVFTDAYMLGGILRNLTTNAVKFTPKGGTITIAAKPISDGLIEISIKDTGIGITKDMMENLFKLDINTNRKGTAGESSTGLGLIICKEFIEKHGGKLRVESEEGKGSTFSFTLQGKKD
jgi:PAS domain S-box-containing protein